MSNEIKFFNTMNRQLQVFDPIDQNNVRMYTCGPTVYNFAHIGNFRAYIFEDLLHRVLKYHNYKVTQVMNLTDVDDKTIRDSQKNNLPLKDFTKKYIEAFFQDLKTLNIQPAQVYPPATAHIPEMISLIQVLMDKGFAYQSDDKCIYFSINKFPEYGKLAHIDRENQRSGVRVKTDEYAKDAIADFALWKAWDEKDGDVFWDSPWGKGRPGWHIECSAMAMKYLGKTFDIHTGGIDNMFPHHEDEIAQSECANGCTYVNYWLHCAHLMVNGEKMSKSAGNFYTLRDLLDKGYSGRELRYVLLGAHYRKKLNFTFDALDQARETLRRFDSFFARLKNLPENVAEDSDLSDLLLTAKKDFAAALADDLNISAALAVVFNLQREVNKFMENGTLSAGNAVNVLEVYKDFDRVFGCFNVDNAGNIEVPEEIVALAEQRLLARKNKNYALADQLRDQLQQSKWQVEDVAGGGFRFKKLD